MQAKEKPAAMGVATGKRKRGSESVFIIVTLFILAVTCIYVAWPTSTVAISRTYNVRSGDTVWHIANDVKAQGDVRELTEIIWQIKHDNLIANEENIHAGDKLIVWMQLPEKELIRK